MAYLLNPYLGDVNPTTVDVLKLYNKAIAAPETKVTLAQKHSKEIFEAFELDSSNFGWGPAISAIPIDAAGTMSVYKLRQSVQWSGDLLDVRILSL